VLALTTIAILTVLVADMQESTSTAYAIATQQRDRLRAEYMAKSGLNLTRLIMSGPNQQQLTATVRPIYQLTLGHGGPGELPVWMAANEILQPFCNFEASEQAGFELGGANDFFGAPGTCEITAQADNAKINVSSGLHFGGDQARLNTAMQLFSLMGGYHSPSPYDPLFDRLDGQGQLTSRLDVVAATIDWWDPDTERMIFDPGASEVSQAGSEDDIYASYEDPYRVKNAAFDSLEELRYIRGVGDDFWATFVEPDPDDIRSRNLTIYGSGRINANEAPAEVLLARTCSIVPDALLCIDPLEAAKFIQVVRTVRSMLPLPIFGSNGDFVNFMRGQTQLYTMLKGILGEENPLLFTPIDVSGQQMTDLTNAFIVVAQIVTIESIGYAGRARVRIRAVVNKDRDWNPPPPNPGSMPTLGIFHHYRVD
jgi:general secretion pathway protein K